jgi:mannose-6-phosphate isomerase
MGANALYPLLLKPVYQNYIWGGRRIPDTFKRNVSMDVCAESWEISTRPEGMSVVRNGPLAGTPLAGLIAERPEAILGTAPPRPGGPWEGGFPLLIKILDAKQNLSVQVHPDEAGAARSGGEAKTEMWIALDADPGAGVYAGLQPGVSRDTFESALRDNALEPLLRFLPLTPGAVVFVPGGRVHAIGAGCLLLEIQQNSNTTYRVYDWGRLGADGAPRPLHVDRALDVIRWDDTGEALQHPMPCPVAGPNRAVQLVHCPYFRVTRHVLNAPLDLASDGTGFTVLFLAAGTLTLDPNPGEALRTGTSCLLPAALPACRLTPLNGPASVILIR